MGFVGFLKYVDVNRQGCHNPRIEKKKCSISFWVPDIKLNDYVSVMRRGLFKIRKDRKYTLSRHLYPTVCDSIILLEAVFRLSEALSSSTLCFFEEHSIYARRRQEVPERGNVCT